MLLTSCSNAPKEPEAVIPEDLKILFIGNSFSTDTIEYVADIALDLGVQTVKLGNLYQGGCSINKHYANAKSNAFAYEYYTNTGEEWKMVGKNTIRMAILSEEWDWIAIQHGTADGSRYAKEESYKNLPALVQYIKEIVGDETKIAFNMTWVGEHNSHEELISYANNQQLYYNAIAALTRDTVVPIEGIDCVSPTGTAIQNTRTSSVKLLTRDNYHLSEGIGRYIAGLTFFKALTGVDISDISFAPDGVTAYQKQVAIESATNAVNTPFEVTDSILNEADFADTEE